MLTKLLLVRVPALIIGIKSPVHALLFLCRVNPALT
jgi:hypothetical protein